jgi:O-acetylserine/cysteine efflux transporter
MAETTRFTGRDYAAALGVILIFGTNFVAMKVALRELTPFQLGAGRYLFAVLPLLLFVRPPRLAPKWVLLYGLLQGVGQFGLLFLSLRVGMSAALASVLVQTQVFFTALFGSALLGEKVGRPLRTGLALAAAGLACFGAHYLSAAGATGATTPAGFALCVAAASMWAASNIVVRRAQRATPRFDVIPFMVWSSLVPIIPFALLSFVFDPQAGHWALPSVSLNCLAALAYLGWFATILAYALWTGLLKRHPANQVAPFSLAVPLVGVAAGMLVLGDQISRWQWGGIALLGASLVVALGIGRRPLHQATTSSGKQNEQTDRAGAPNPR